MIFLLVLASIMANMASGALQAWMPESYTAPLLSLCAIPRSFLCACSAKKRTAAYTDITLHAECQYSGVVTGASEHPPKWPVIAPIDHGLGSSSSISDEGRSLLSFTLPSFVGGINMIFLLVWPPYWPTWPRELFKHGCLNPIPGPAPFSVRAVKKRTAAYTDITLHAECQYSGVVTGASITATLYKKNSDGDYVLATPATTTLTTMDRSLVIDGTGQTKWCSKGCTTVDTGSYKCEISMDKTGMEKQTLSDTFDIKVFEEPGEDVTLAPGETEDPNVTDDDYDYVYEYMSITFQ
nr:protein E2 [Equid gammaherpesvirus 5]